MSIIGKGSLSLKKKDVAEQKSIALGFKKVRFAHKATFGDTGINLTSLVTPTEMSTYGFVNPSVGTLSTAQLNFFRNNLKLVSSFRGQLIDQLSYIVSSSTQINFVDFTAEDGEIFTGTLDEAPATSLSVVDGRTIVASGILLAGQTDFNIGTPITINQNPSQQIGAVMVYVDRGLQFRKVGNTTTGDGDYIEVPVAGGLGSLIRFNTSGVDRFITVVSNGVVAERPDGSMMAAIERVQGQVDAMVPTLATVAGVPTTTFQTAPNSVDLKQFGDQVISNTASIAADSTRITTLEGKQTANFRLDTGNGVGSTGTFIRRFSGVRESNSNGIVSYIDDPTYGASFTAIKRCRVFAVYGDHSVYDASFSYSGSALSLNATTAQLAQDGITLPANIRVAVTGFRIPGGTAYSSYGLSCMYVGIMQPGDVLRPHLLESVDSTTPLAHMQLVAEEV